MKLYAKFANIIFCFALLWLSFVLIWQLFSWQNFHYPFWYQQLSIAEHIQKYAPGNRMGKQNFVLTTQDQHEKIFAQVVQSINHSGRGLDDINYQVTAQSTSYKMFTHAEVVHLQDVANLIDTMKIFSVVIILTLMLTLGFFYYKEIPLAGMKYHLIYTVGTLGATVLLVILLGAKKVFYWLHIKIFPEDHQWFFLYRDSLMSTFMKAPDLFAPIAVSWLLASIVLWLGLLYACNKLLKRFGNH